jgi:hypothetical protein
VAGSISGSVLVGIEALVVGSAVVADIALISTA